MTRPVTPDEAREMLATARRIVDPEDGSVEELMESGPDVIEALLALVASEPERIAAAFMRGVKATHAAAIEAVDFTMPINNHRAAPVREALEALRAMPLPEDEGAPSGGESERIAAARNALRAEVAAALAAFVESDHAVNRALAAGDVRDEYHPTLFARLARLDALRGLLTPETTT